jgi:hypothetical protein
MIKTDLRVCFFIVSSQTIQYHQNGIATIEYAEYLVT